jgi:hypothetical protein
LHGTLGLMAVAFTQNATPGAGAQAGHGRGVNRMDGMPLASQTHRFDWQLRNAPTSAPSQTEHPQRASRAPSPARRGSTPSADARHKARQRGQHRDQHDSDEVSGVRKQTANKVDGSGPQVHWQGSQVACCIVKLGHFTSLTKPS